MSFLAPYLSTPESNTMPSSRAILADIHEFGLDPKKPHVTNGATRLAKAQAPTLTVSVESAPAEVEQPTKEIDESLVEVLADEAKATEESVVTAVKEETVKKPRGFQKKAQQPVS